MELECFKHIVYFLIETKDILERNELPLINKEVNKKNSF